MKRSLGKLFLIISCSAVVLLSSCAQSLENPDIIVPSNLVTVVNVQAGEVSIYANADFADYFTFTFNRPAGDTVIEATDGVGVYTYTEDGQFVVSTKAFNNNGDFIEVTDTVEIVLVGDVPTVGYTTPLSYPGYTLVWNDEFSGTSLSSDWTHEIGNGASGWGNNELEYYRPENTQVAGGLLTIIAKQESYGGKNYTSSRIKTQGHKSFNGGRIDIRAQLPFGKGIWPALWMLGDNINAVGWPACGEIDIMEMVGGTGYNDRTIYGTIHWDNGGAYANYGGSSSLPSGKYADEFHVFSIIWDDNSIKWLRDDIQYQEADITPALLSEFHNNFFLLINLAVGGDWPGSPDGFTVFPQTLRVDYVRVFQ